MILDASTLKTVERWSKVKLILMSKSSPCRMHASIEYVYTLFLLLMTDSASSFPLLILYRKPFRTHPLNLPSPAAALAPALILNAVRLLFCRRLL